MAVSVERLIEQMLREQREMLEEQKRINRLLRFVAHRQARELIESQLEKSIERRVYELSDGIRSSREIEKLVNKVVTQRTVVTWWQKWRRLGLVEQSPNYSGRMQKVMPLEELGLTTEVNGQMY
jgi:hypothetical protein